MVSTTHGTSRCSSPTSWRSAGRAATTVPGSPRWSSPAPAVRTCRRGRTASGRSSSSSPPAEGGPMTSPRAQRRSRRPRRATARSRHRSADSSTCVSTTAAWPRRLARRPGSAAPRGLAIRGHRALPPSPHGDRAAPGTTSSSASTHARFPAHPAIMAGSRSAALSPACPGTTTSTTRCCAGPLQDLPRGRLHCSCGSAQHDHRLQRRRWRRSPTRRPCSGAVAIRRRWLSEFRSGVDRRADPVGHPRHGSSPATAGRGRRCSPCSKPLLTHRTNGVYAAMWAAA